MSTYTQILYHIVFTTKYREPILTKPGREQLFNYIGQVVRNKKCLLHRINGVEDHIHLLTNLHPTIPLASLVKDIKMASMAFIKEQNLFEGFEGWQLGYGAFTHDTKAKKRLMQYIENQERHHKIKSVQSEYMELLHEHDVKFDENYLF